MTRRLLIVDRYDGVAISLPPSSPGESWDILLLGLSHEWFLWLHRAQLHGRTDWQLVELETLAPEACSQVGTFIVGTVPQLPERDLGGMSLAGLLRQPTGSEWWFLEISEKGPYRGPLVSRLYRLALIGLVVARGGYTEVWHSLSEVSLANVLKQQSASVRWIARPCRPLPEPALAHWPLIRYWVQAFRAVGTLWMSRILCRTWLGLWSSLPHEPEVTFTMYPAWWSEQPAAPPRELFFARRTTGRPQTYLAWLTRPASLWRRRAAVRETFRAQGVIALQHFLRAGDAVALLAPARFLRLLVFKRRMAPRLRVAFAGFQVGDLLSEEIGRSMSSAELFLDLLVVRAIRAAAAAMRPRCLLYRAEFQPIENALLRGLEATDTPGIGFVHFPFGERYLSMRFAPAESGVDAMSRPFPKGLVAIGPAAARHAEEGGYLRGRVAVCGPQRYGGLASYRNRAPSRQDIRRQLGLSDTGFIALVALAMVKTDTESLCAALAGVSKVHPDAVFIIRTHPYERRKNRPVGALLSALGDARARLMPAHWLLYDAIRAADVMVCVGSMIAFEAMALGVMPICFENPATYPATSLAEFGRGLFVARNTEELCRSIESVRSQDEQQRRREQAWPEVLADVFGDLDRPLEVQMEEAVSSILVAYERPEEASEA